MLHLLEIMIVFCCCLLWLLLAIMTLVIIYMCNINFGTSLFLFSVSFAGAELFLVDLGYRGLRGQVLVAQRNAPQEQAMLGPLRFGDL